MYYFCNSWNFNVRKTRLWQRSHFCCRTGAAAQVCFAGESAETLSLFLNEVGKQVLQNFLGEDPKQMKGSYLESTIMSIARLDVWVAIVVHCFVE